jgi:hypothetical protein
MAALSRPSRSLDDPAKQAGGLLIRLGIAILAIGVPCGAVLSRRVIFSVMPVGAVLILIGVALDPRRPQLERLRTILASPSALTAIFILGWIGLTLAWTPFTGLAAERYFKTTGTLLLAAITAACLPTHTKTSNLYLLPIGLGIAALGALAFAIVAPPPPAQEIETSTLDRAALTLTILIWPALGALAVRDRWASAGALAVAVAVAVIAIWTPTALAALAIGAVTFSLATSAPQRVGRVLGIGFAALVVLAPAIPLVLAPLLQNSTGAFSRTVLAAERFVTDEGLRLITGHGLDTASRSVVLGYLPAGTPRSAIFEIWYEFGVVGALAVAMLIVLAFRGASLAPRPAAAFLLAALVCGLVIGLSGLVTAQLWWITLLAVVGIQFALVLKGQYRSVRPAAQVVNAGSPQMQS